MKPLLLPAVWMLLAANAAAQYRPWDPAHSYSNSIQGSINRDYEEKMRDPEYRARLEAREKRETEEQERLAVEITSPVTRKYRLDGRGDKYEILKIVRISPKYIWYNFPPFRPGQVYRFERSEAPMETRVAFWNMANRALDKAPNLRNRWPKESLLNPRKAR